MMNKLTKIIRVVCNKEIKDSGVIHKGNKCINIDACKKKKDTSCISFIILIKFPTIIQYKVLIAIVLSLNYTSL